MGIAYDIIILPCLPYFRMLLQINCSFIHKKITYTFLLHYSIKLSWHKIQIWYGKQKKQFLMKFC